MKWLLYSLGRALVVFGESLFTFADRCGWSLVHAWGTKAQIRTFSQRRMLDFMNELKAFENQIQAAKPAPVKVVLMPPPDSVN